MATKNQAQVFDDIAKAITGGGAAAGGEAVPKKPSIEELRALRNSRTGGLGNDFAGKNTGGRHDSSRGSLYRGGGQERLLMPPSSGREMTQKQESSDEQAMNMVHDAIGGTDVSGIGPQNLNAGVVAITNIAKGSTDPKDIAAAKQFVVGVQAGKIPMTPQIDKLMGTLKRSKLLNQSNIPAF
jgi:hypothetical protein